MQGTSRKKLLVGSAAAAAVLVVASSAYACTVYKGKVTLTTTEATDNTAVAQGDATGGVPHAYCQGEQTQQVNMNGSNEFTIAVAPSTSPCGTTQVTDKVYQVRWINMTGASVLDKNGNPLKQSYNCNVLASNVHVLHEFTTTNGAYTTPLLSNLSGGPLGTATPPDGASGLVNICVAPKVSTAVNDSPPELSVYVI